MPRYCIVRNVPGATQEDVDASAMRAIWCLAEYPRVQWVRSYWDQEAEQILCVYDAPNAQMLRDHSASSRLACDEVHEVHEFGPATYLQSADVPQEERAGHIVPGPRSATNAVS